MQRERTIPKSRAVPTSNNPLDPYDCGYLYPMPAPDAALAKLAIEVAPVEIQALTYHLASDGLYDSYKPYNLLLYGESGTGKTTLAQAIAIESEHPYSFVNCCWLGNEVEDSESDNLHRIVNYALAQKQKPYIIILNDMAGFLKGDVIEEEAYTLARLLRQYEENPGIYFIGIVPPPHTITPLVAKFFNKKTLSFPNQEAREKAIVYNLNKLQPRTTYQCPPQHIQKLSSKTEHFCYFYLKRLVNDASAKAHMREMNVQATITESDVEEAFNKLQQEGKRWGLLPKTALDHIQEHPYCAIAAGTTVTGAVALVLTRILKNS